ncbi:MAG: PIN domain-containing protein [Gammaproteobacteria bacterium]
MHLALTDLFRAKWTNAIHDEWIRNVLNNRPDLKKSQLERTRALMNSHARDCLVDGYEKLINALTLPDPDDRHVLAAAIRSSASIIVTFNLKDFPSDILKEYGIEAQHPDLFLIHLLDLSPQIVYASIRRLRLGLKNPPVEQERYLEILKAQSLVHTVENLMKNIDMI